MFGCCGCPSKKNERTVSEDEDEEKEEKVVAAAEPVQDIVPEKVELVAEVPKVEVVLVADVVKVELEVVADVPKIEQKPEKPVVVTILDEESYGHVPSVLPSPRKSSLKKPKPRLSISTEVKIIPSDDIEEDAQSPLSDEVFAGEGCDPPRANLGVSPKGPLPQAVDFPRSPALEVPLSPRGKAPTPHPKRASMPSILPRWLSEDEDEIGGSLEPPVTPVRRLPFITLASLLFPVSKFCLFSGCQGRTSSSSSPIFR